MMTREEIDLREKIADEIIEASNASENNGNTTVAMRRAAGIVRWSINHNAICPCSLCSRFQIKSCADKSNHRRISAEEAQTFMNRQECGDGPWECGWCNHGKNEWKISELLWDIENEFAISPCCHTEATEALELPEEDDFDQLKEDNDNYRCSITGRM